MNFTSFISALILQLCKNSVLCITWYACLLEDILNSPESVIIDQFDQDFLETISAYFSPGVFQNPSIWSLEAGAPSGLTTVRLCPSSSSALAANIIAEQPSPMMWVSDFIPRFLPGSCRILAQSGVLCCGLL